MTTQDVKVVSKAILLAGYGTRSGNLEEILEIQARRLRARGWDVEVGYFRISTPTIQDALKTLMARGADEIVTVPYFIAEGVLTKELIPQRLGIDAEFGTVEIDGRTAAIHMAPAFGVNPALTNIILDRVADAKGDKDCGVLIIGHGTRYSALSNLNVIKLNANRIRGMGYEHVDFAFNEFCEPTIKDALDRLEKQGVEKIVAVPLFIAMGVHLGEEIPDQLGIKHYSNGGKIKVNGREIDLVYTNPMEYDPRLTDLVSETASNYLGE